MNDNQEEESNLKSRRSFLNYLLGTSAFALLASIFYPVFSYLIPPKKNVPVVKSVIAAKVGELKPNSGMIFRFGKIPAILIDTPKGELRAFTATCTHLGCIVQYRADLERIWCACHNGQYDLNGINISGPPPRPLTPFKVNVKNGEVYVSVADNAV
ncbi:cytochrome b6-f complex iron-sulfur subunit [bacterium BMS3Abin03]|nr:cytochrome b6-f complex iron-sulfur subunit [bacterium BMS3Abin03]